MNDPHPKEHSASDLLRELFPGTHREIFGEVQVPGEKPLTLGLYEVADGRLALVQGGHLAEFTPLAPKGSTALHCDLCHYTRSRSEASVYRVLVGARRTRYVTLCSPSGPCQKRAGAAGLAALADHIFPIEALYGE